MVKDQLPPTRVVARPAPTPGTIPLIFMVGPGSPHSGTTHGKLTPCSSHGARVTVKVP